MKSILGLFCALLVTIAIQAQPELPITFEDTATVNYDLVPFGGVVANLAVDPVDTSNLVGCALKDTLAQTWAGITMGGSGLASPIAFSAVRTQIQVRVYSSDAGTPILLKVEDAGNPAISSEVQVNTTMANAWETLVFDFAGGTPALNFANTYDKISIFFNFGNMNTSNKNYYWDDVELLPAMLVMPELPITFEDTATVDYNLTPFGGVVANIAVDPVDTNNLVGCALKDTFAQTWAGVSMGGSGLANPIAFSAVRTQIQVRVYSSDAGTPILLKVEDAGNPAISSEVLVNTTVANAWETLVFDFAGGTPALNFANTYDKISIFFNFGNMNTANKNYYWDDVELLPATVSMPELPITFDDTATVNYDLVAFGGVVANIAVDPVDTNNLVGCALKDTFAQTWAGVTMGGGGLASPIAFSASRTKIQVRVYSSDAGTPILLKVEDAGNPAISSEVLVNTTVANAWETLEFDFAGGTPALNFANTYDKISIFFNFGNMNTSNKNYYWDDVELLPVVLGMPELPITFEDTATINYDLVPFGGVVANIAVDPLDANNLVGCAFKDTLAQVWAGVSMGGAGLANPIAFSAGQTTISVRVYSSDAGTPILLKVEDAGNPAISSEVLVNTTVANAWETLEFDFAGGTPALNFANTYDKISIFFNFGNMNTSNKNYYWDDVELLEMLLDLPDLPITFQDTATVDYDLTPFGGATAVIALDPTDSTNLVGCSVKDTLAMVWAGVTMGDAGLANPIPFSATDTRIRVRVYSPDAGIPVLLKVEDASNGAISSELTVNTTVSNAWDTLVFDFATGTPALNLANTYDKISIFFNFLNMNTTNKTYYWDDVEFIVGGGMVLDPPELPITFQDTATVNYDLVAFGGATANLAVDPVDTANLVGCTLKDTFALTFAGVTMGGAGLNSPIAFTSTDTRIQLRVYSPDAGIPVLLKVEDASNGAISSEIAVNTTLSNQWETMVFDFASGAPALDTANTYDKITIFFNFGSTNTTNKLYYWDDVELLLGGGVIKDKPELPITFQDTATVNYELLDFAGNISSIDADPSDSTNLVGKVERQASAATFAGTIMGASGLKNPIAFSNFNKRIQVRVFSPEAGIPVLLKVENAANKPITCEVQDTTTIANAWDTLVFDFGVGTPALNLAEVYDKIIIFFNFGVDGATAGMQTFCWDDVELLECMNVVHVGGVPGAQTYEAQSDITSDAKITAAKKVIFKAGNSILLGDDGAGNLADFEIELGAEFDTILLPCGTH